MRYPRVILPMTIVGTLLYLLIGSVGWHVPSQRLLFIGSFLYVVMLPGYIVARLVTPRLEGTLRVLAWFVFGTTLAYGVLFIAAVAHLDIRIIALGPLTLAIALVFRERRRRNTHPTESDGGATLPSEGSAPRLILVGLLVAVSLMILLRGDPLIYSGDSADHIAYIRTVARTHEAFPREFYYRGGGITTHDIRKGMGQAMWGALISLTGTHDAGRIWPLLCLASTLSLIVALYCAGLMLFRSPSIGLLAAILLVLFYTGGLRDHKLATSAGGYTFGRVFYVTALAFLPYCLARRQCGYFPLMIASAFAATCTHFTYFAALAFVTGVFTFSTIITGPGAMRIHAAKRGGIVGAAIVLANAPYLAMRYLIDYVPANPIHTQLQGVLYLAEKFYVLNPVVFFEGAGELGALSFLSIFILWRKSKTDDHLRLLLHGLVAVYVLVFNPLWFPFLFGKVSYLLIRFEFAVPSVIICSYLLRELWVTLRWGGHEMSRLGAAIGVAAVAVFLGYPIAKTPAGFAFGKQTFQSAAASGYRSLDDLFEFIERECPRGSSFAADPITSFGIPAFTDAYAICPYDQHSIPNDTTAIRRIRDCREILNPITPLPDVWRLLMDYKTEYLVINGRIPSSVPRLYWGIDAETAREVTARLREPTSSFRIVFDHADCTVARLVTCRSCVSIDRRPVRRNFLGDSIPSCVAEGLPPSGIDEIRIVELRPSSARASRGTSIGVDITWVATKACAFSSYVGYVRFDTDFPKSTLYREPFGKTYRKALETISGQRSRFRFDFQPLGGLDPPDTWPLLHAIKERVLIAIPRDIAPGSYAISLKMARKTQYPNYVLADIFTDHDVYCGATVGSILIE